MAMFNENVSIYNQEHSTIILLLNLIATDIKIFSQYFQCYNNCCLFTIKIPTITEIESPQQ